MRDSSSSNETACAALDVVESFATALQKPAKKGSVNALRVSTVLAEAYAVLNVSEMPANVRQKVGATLSAVVKAIEVARAAENASCTKESERLKEEERRREDEARRKTERLFRRVLAVVALVVVVIAAWKGSFVVALLLFMFAASCLGVNVDWRLLLKRVKDAFNPST